MSFLIKPLFLIMVGLVAALLVKNQLWKRRLLLGSLLALFMLSNDFIANEVMRTWEIEVTPFEAITKTYDYGILLTGITRNDLEPADRVYFTHGADRVVHTAELYQRGIIGKIIVSGGVGRVLTEGRPEADELRKVLLLMGVSDEDIIIENESENTRESAVRVKQLLDNLEWNNALLITSAFHMRRSKACFLNVGLNIDVFATDFYTHPRHFTPESLFIPSADALVVWHKLFKEWAGMIAYRLAGYI
ncbi:MAG: YdcF family protein [Cyclobacteriaceae bacterium]|nr:YdcF family protein [Cyclobacteriaceae bacterium]